MPFNKGFKIKKVIAGHGTIDPKRFTPEQYARIKQMANPRRGIVTQLAPAPGSLGSRKKFIKAMKALHERPPIGEKRIIKLEKRIGRLMATK